MDTKKEKGYSHFLSAIFSGLFLTLIAIGAYLVIYFQGAERLLQPITPWEFLILVLATFRLTRLFVYDSIFQFIRDLCLEVSHEKKDGRVYVKRTKPKYHPLGIRRLFCELLACPWCIGIWLSGFILFLFYISPYSWPVLILLAIAGVSTFIQITANKIGWEAEKSKLKVQKYESKAQKD